MRRIFSTSMLIAFAATSSAAMAQDSQARSVNDYLCAFAGKCGGEEEPAETKDAPETKGFSLSRQNTAATKKSPDTKGFSLGRGPAPARTARSAPRPAPAARPARRAAPAIARATPRTAKAVASRGRADLRLSFELGSATLTAEGRESARIFAQSLMMPELASKRFVIEGHTDRVGNRAYNLDLSRRRAQAVADYLTSLGVSADRLEVKGFGFDRPLEGRSASSQENRRVEAVLAS